MYELKKYQTDIVDRFKDKSHGALFMGMGAGKTATSVRILKHKFEGMHQDRFVVIGPSATLKGWTKEIEKFWPDCPLHVHLSNKQGPKRKKELEEFARLGRGILIINYEALLTNLLPIIKAFNPQGYILDESQYVKSHKSKRSKIMFELRQNAMFCYILTGTPILNSITDLFMPMKICDMGKTFGSNYYVFQRKYMVDKNSHFAHASHYFPNWVVRNESIPEIKSKLKDVSVILKTKDVIHDLPPFVTKTYNVNLNAEQKKAYKELEKLLITEIKKDEFITVENALTKVLRLNQICAGHLSADDKELKFEKTEKVTVTVDLVKQIVEMGEKVIIWTAYTPEVGLLTKALKAEGFHDILYITGAENATQKGEAEYEFNNSARFPILIANLAAGNAGINLQVASHSINYSRNYSLAHALQSEARNYRQGSQIHSTIFQHNVVVEGSIEEDILEALEAKKELAKDVLDNVDKIKEVEKALKNEILQKFMRG